MDLKQFPNKKRLTTSLLGDELDRRVQAYISYLQSNGAVINSTVVISVAQGIVSTITAIIYQSKMVDTQVSRSWAKHLLYHMGFTKGRTGTKVKL